MIIVIAGHYGVGKTNLALNMALDYKSAGWDVSVADVDVVNPYFRSSDYSSLLNDAGVKVIAPNFAGTSLDTPSLPASLPGAIERAGMEDGDTPQVLIVDIGGDDVGATAIARYSATINRFPYEFLYVVNCYRNLTQKPEEAMAVLREIEMASHLHATGIVNNSHLRDDTTADTVREAEWFGEACATLTGLPLIATTVPSAFADAFSALPQSGYDEHGDSGIPSSGKNAFEPCKSTSCETPIMHEAPFASLLARNKTSGQLAQKNNEKNYYIVRKLVLTPWE